MLSLIFGIVALATIKRTGQEGRAMAMAGLLLSAPWTVALVAITAFVLLTSAERDEQGVITEGCDARLEAYSTSAVEDPDIGLFNVFPLERNWIAGDRSVSCLVLRLSGACFAGSVRALERSGHRAQVSLSTGCSNGRFLRH